MGTVTISELKCYGIFPTQIQVKGLPSCSKVVFKGLLKMGLLVLFHDCLRDS